MGPRGPFDVFMIGSTVEILGCRTNRMPLLSGSPRRSGRRWRFTWEALGHIPTLRLFLFSSDVEASSVCENLEALLFLGESRLVVKWREEEAADLELRVPVPRVLVDPSAPVQVFSRKDHIEVKLVLVLPLDHLTSMDSRSALETAAFLSRQGGDLPGWSHPFSSDSDIKHLSTGDVHFYCKTCRTRLTNKPARKIVELPSADWRDVADNWFGTGCCSFGGISEKLVRAYIKAYSCTESTCLLDGPSITICKDDLEGYEFTPRPCKSSSHNNMEDVNDDAANKIIEDKCAEMKHSDVSHGSSLHEAFSNDSLHCCADDWKFTSSGVGRDGLYNVSLGSGCMIKSCNLSDEVQWIEFSCKHCSTLLGSYPSMKGGNDPMDGGIRLFKCYVSTSMDDSSSDDVFRKHTLQKIFARLLLESASDELSFHTTVKDLHTRLPVLHIVLMNSKAWCSSGECFENELNGPLSEAPLQPVLKVLFSDYCTAARAMEECLTSKHSEEVFMLTRQTDELTNSLKAAHHCLPLSCSSFQGMSLSYMER